MLQNIILSNGVFSCQIRGRKRKKLGEARVKQRSPGPDREPGPRVRTSGAAHLKRETGPRQYMYVPTAPRARCFPRQLFTRVPGAFDSSDCLWWVLLLKRFVSTSKPQNCISPLLIVQWHQPPTRPNSPSIAFVVMKGTACIICRSKTSPALVALASNKMMSP